MTRDRLSHLAAVADVSPFPVAAPEQRRSGARHQALMARVHLREAAKLIDDPGFQAAHDRALRSLLEVDALVEALVDDREAA